MASNNLVPVQLQPNSSLADNIAYINQNFRVLADAFNPIIMSDGTNNRTIVGRYVHSTGIYYGIFGFDSDGTLVRYDGVNPKTKKYGIYLTKTGIDVLNELLA